MNGDGAATFVLGVTRHWTKRIVGTGLAKSINLVATDFRWWLAVLLVVFTWSAYPEFIKEYQARPLAKISREVDALTKEKDKRIWQRHLTDDQKSKLRDGLCSSPEEFAGVEIRAEREPEGLQYADEIADMFRRCHIKLWMMGDIDPNPIGVDTIGYDSVGIFVEVADRDAPKGPSRDLLKIIKDAGLSVHYWEHKGIPSEPWVFVGYKETTSPRAASPPPLKTPLICQTGPNRSAKSGWFCSI